MPHRIQSAALVRSDPAAVGENGRVAAIVVDSLRKRYGSIDAVRGVSFEVAAGEVFALLGPNGAGKTTIVEILEGFRGRDSGTVKVLGFDPADRSTTRALRERLGIVLQELAIEPFLTVREVLSRNAGFYPDPRPVDEVIALVGLEDKAGARVKKLSGGQQRRLDVGLGIVGNPDLIFLDEPTTGFDPSARRSAWSLLRDLRGRGTTIVLTTHYMDEAEALADHVAVIANGEIVAQGVPASLGERDVAAVRIRFRLPDDTDPAELPVPASIDGDRVSIETDDELAVLNQLTGWALRRHLKLPGLIVERMTLEDVYLGLTGASDRTSEP
jgi:ABC-2 type transport system ATP-binding protein